MNIKQKLNITIAQPKGFCGGVTRAIKIVESALEKFGAPIYVRHEIVHNRYVVEKLKKDGIIFVKEVDEIPEGSVTIFSAHGVASKVEDDAKKRKLIVFNATCPLVERIHKEGAYQVKRNKVLILIGHAGHPEVEGTIGRVDGEIHLITSIDDVDNFIAEETKEYAFITQTTLSLTDTQHIIEALKIKIPLIEGPDLKNICYATQNRQTAVRELVENIDALIVIGSQNSSNSNRLKEIATEKKIKSFLVDSEDQISKDIFKDVKELGLTAGASAPEELVEIIINKISQYYDVNIRYMEGIEEQVNFKIPEELR